MARFSGGVGYGEAVEDPPDSGIWVDLITERNYQGDVIRNSRQNEDGDKVNNDITLQNSISIVADDYAVEHVRNIKYVHWAGTLWTVSSVEVRRPRLILTLGNVYNGPLPEVVEPEEDP